MSVGGSNGCWHTLLERLKFPCWASFPFFHCKTSQWEGKGENDQNLSEGMFALPVLYYKRRFWWPFVCIDAVGNLDVHQSTALDRWHKCKSDRLATCLHGQHRAQESSQRLSSQAWILGPDCSWVTPCSFSCDLHRLGTGLTLLSQHSSHDILLSLLQYDAVPLAIAFEKPVRLDQMVSIVLQPMAPQATYIRCIYRGNPNNQRGFGLQGQSNLQSISTVSTPKNLIHIQKLVGNWFSETLHIFGWSAPDPN